MLRNDSADAAVGGGSSMKPLVGAGGGADGGADGGAEGSSDGEESPSSTSATDWRDTLMRAIRFSRLERTSRAERDLTGTGAATGVIGRAPLETERSERVRAGLPAAAATSVEFAWRKAARAAARSDGFRGREGGRSASGGRRNIGSVVAADGDDGKDTRSMRRSSSGAARWARARFICTSAATRAPGCRCRAGSGGGVADGRGRQRETVRPCGGAGFSSCGVPSGRNGGESIHSKQTREEGASVF